MIFISKYQNIEAKLVDRVSKDIRRKNMQAIKASKTKLENEVIKELWKRGFRFRRNVKDLFGKPDIAIKKYNIIIFIDSCYWHGCPTHSEIPATNTNFWREKIQKNKERDIKVNDYYLTNNWNILRIWEHDLKQDFDQTINKIAKFIKISKELKIN